MDFKTNNKINNIRFNLNNLKINEMELGQHAKGKIFSHKEY